MTGAYCGERWRKARRAALKRDDYTCQKCGSGTDIHAHHIIPVREFETTEDAHYPENLVALCAHCHGTVEGEPQWPNPDSIESDDGLSHVADLLALDTVSRLSTGLAAPEIVRRFLWPYKHTCTCCLSRFRNVDETHQNPFDGYHRALYRIVVYGKGLDDNPSEPAPKEYSFCDECLSNVPLVTASGELREEIGNRIADLLEVFGFNQSHTASFARNSLVENIRDPAGYELDIQHREYHNAVQIGLMTTFGCEPDPVSDISRIRTLYRTAVTERYGEGIWSHENDLQLPDRFEGFKDDGGIGIPDWYRNGETGPTDH